ncbi:MAG: hypothetical protein COB37_09350 [Kordiimonadales bacterium]|nr:MAG: hypothetical protein COB37_09350 [Kordiimonadales bacterium]
MKLAAKVWFAIYGLALLAVVSAPVEATGDDKAVDIVRPMVVPNDPAFRYFPNLLKAVMEATKDTHGAYIWRPWVPDVSGGSVRRRARMMKQGGALNVLFTAEAAAAESGIITARYHINKGLYGYRVLLIRRGDAARFVGIKGKEDLSALTAGQGRGWPDVSVYLENNLPVEATGQFQSLLSMLAAGRFDYYPLGIVEATSILKQCGDDCSGLMIEPNLLLHYPFPIFFQVSATASHLVGRLEKGMEKVLANGKFEEIWRKHHDPLLAEISLSNRTIIELSNARVPAFTKLDRADLWVDIRRY